MIKQLSLRKFKFFIRDYWSTLLTGASLVVIFMLLSFSYKTFKESKNQLDILQEEVKLLKNRSDTLKYNKSLTEDQIVTYNRLLTALIPESEDYFSIIYALETVAKETKFDIVAYTINLSKSSMEKISINVEGRGDLDSFLRFLQNYEFTGGRLITSEKIEFSGLDFTNTKVALNFYNKRFTFNESVIPQLTREDITKLEEIEKKVKISFKEDGDTEDTGEYETKSDPF